MTLEQRVEQANAKVLNIILNGQPTWTDVQPAGKVIPGMLPNMIFYAGPTIAPENIVPPVRAAICGAAVHEGLASDAKEAWRKVLGGEIQLASGQDYGCANGAAMATSASMPVHVVRDTVNDTLGFCVPHPGGEREVLRWGFYNEKIEASMVWFRDVFGPALGAAVRQLGGISLREIMAKTAGMGDENHVRQPASSMLQALILIPALLDTDVPGRDDVIRFLAANDRFFLHVMMAGVESVMMAAKKIKDSTVLVGLGGNGVELGIQMAGTGNQWHTTAAPKILGRFLNPEWSEKDILGFLGDSCVTEVYGLGGFSAIAGPAYVRLTGAPFEEARRRTERARAVALGEHKFAPIPWDDYRGFPAAIDIRKIVATNVAPISHGGSTLIAGGQGGAGSAALPMEMFRKALIAFADQAKGEAQ